PGNFDAVFNGPVTAATALQRSLNVPAVDLLDRIGPARFAARLVHAGIELRFPRRASPNLALVLGGTGARLEDLVGAHAALHRDGLRSDRGAGAREGMFDGARRRRVGGSAGTSYGCRGAWARGGTRRYPVGVWVGRPDGAPLPGQYGALTALPLLFEVVDSLPRGPGDGAPVPPPPSVEKREVCWPLGTAIESQPPELCQRRFEAWVLDRVVPPTLAEREARAWSAGIERFEVDAATGLRLSAHCRR